MTLGAEEAWARGPRLVRGQGRRADVGGAMLCSASIPGWQRRCEMEVREDEIARHQGRALEREIWALSLLIPALGIGGDVQRA